MYSVHGLGNDFYDGVKKVRENKQNQKLTEEDIEKNKEFMEKIDKMDLINLVSQLHDQNTAYAIREKKLKLIVKRLKVQVKNVNNAREKYKEVCKKFKDENEELVTKVKDLRFKNHTLLGEVKEKNRKIEKLEQDGIDLQNTNDQLADALQQFGGSDDEDDDD